ncbi:YceD family protein [Segniliparus rotundus]|uniref:YceD family protein n=1 Tax=Segniliparus rotundus TaxID=286802 RepID=UPI001FDFCFD0|nr:YceD family protein [Segniliparus rotundus]
MTSPDALSRVFDPRHPWALDIRQLQSSSEPLRGAFDFPAPERIGGEMIAVEPGAPVRLALELFETEDGVSVTGRFQAPTVGQCSRCLEPFAGSVESSFREFFSFAPAQDEEEAPVVIAGKIDVEQPVIDSVVLGFPLAPLCEPGCPGLCVECGALLAAEPPGHSHEQIDPRWSVLREKFALPEDVSHAEADDVDLSGPKEVGGAS